MAGWGKAIGLGRVAGCGGREERGGGDVHLFASAHRAYGREEAHHFFDDGEGVGEFVEELRGASEEVWDAVEVGAEDGVVFVPDPSERCGVLVEGVVDPLLGFGVRVVSVI